MSEIITCPSGLSGRIREIKFRELRILADRQFAKNNTQLDKILTACWEETLDPGPYDFDGSSVDFSKVLQGDRLFVLLRIRALSYDPEYEFSVPCDNRACRAGIHWAVDLRELPVKPLPEESRKLFLSGNRFETVLPQANRKVTFKLLTGADERRMAKLRKSASEQPLATLLNYRLESIEGVEPGDKENFIEDLGMADVSFLLGEFERVDCGVETQIEIECPECQGVMTIDLPFDRSFFLPVSRKQARSDSFRR